MSDIQYSILDANGCDQFSSAGMIASAASACTVQGIRQFEPLVLKHHQNALTALNETLSADLSVENSTATIFAIKTLLLIAVSPLVFR